MDSPAFASAAQPVAPVLFLIFNRPATTLRVLAAIRQARPARLYVAADGPRPDRPAEAAQCEQTRRLVLDQIDWPCEVHTLLRDENLGCSRNVSAAIRWFFEHEEEGLILEDDCLPSPDFFPFCTEMLARYRHDNRVWHVGGTNLDGAALRPPTAQEPSYFFSSRVHVWGWATWRRAWAHYDYEYDLLPQLQAAGLLSSIHANAFERRYWLPHYHAMRQGPRPFHTWDLQWHFTVAAQSGLTVVPAVTLVENIGFGAGATHTTGWDPLYTRRVTLSLPWPLRHPPACLRHHQRDERYAREFFRSRLVKKLVGWWPWHPSPAPPPLPAAQPAVPIPVFPELMVAS